MYYEVCANPYALYLQITRICRSEKSGNSSNAKYLLKIVQLELFLHHYVERQPLFCGLCLFFCCSPLVPPPPPFSPIYCTFPSSLSPKRFCRAMYFVRKPLPFSLCACLTPDDLCLSPLTNNETCGLI